MSHKFIDYMDTCKACGVSTDTAMKMLYKKAGMNKLGVYQFLGMLAASALPAFIWPNAAESDLKSLNEKYDRLADTALTLGGAGLGYYATKDNKDWKKKLLATATGGGLGRAVSEIGFK